MMGITVFSLGGERCGMDVGDFSTELGLSIPMGVSFRVSFGGVRRFSIGRVTCGFSWLGTNWGGDLLDDGMSSNCNWGKS